jgi:PhnB protein
MARKRGSRSSARKSTRKSGRKAAAPSRRASAKGERSATGAQSATSRRKRRSRAKRGAGLATRVKRTARKVLFGSLGVAGYVSDVARRRARDQTKVSGAVKPIPDGYHTVTPYLVVRDVPRLIEFLRQAFGATELIRAPRPDGSIMHAEVAIGDSRVMMGEPPGSSPPMPGCVHLYVVDTDALYHLALQAGATSLREPTDQFYGDRIAGVQDPVGNQWWIATHTEDVSPAELARRAAARPSGT